MSEPIRSPYKPPLHSSNAESQDIPRLSKQIRTQVLTLAQHLQKVLEDPSLSAQKTFLQELSTNVLGLNQTVEQANLVR